MTIGSGIDLKERSRQYFKGLGVPDAVIDKLAPYFGMKVHVNGGEKNSVCMFLVAMYSKQFSCQQASFFSQGEAAQDYLTKNPLELTESQAEDLSNAVMKDSVINVEKRYNAAIGAKTFLSEVCYIRGKI